VLQVRPDLGRIEKWVLRKAFDDEEEPFLPKVAFKFKILL
jgi:asparagine synthase (glutamine-hydrolysing)